MININKKLFLGLFTLIAIFGFTVFSQLVSAQGTAMFQSGNIMTGGNRSNPTVDWTDPVDARPGEVVEMRVVAQNTAPSTVSNNVKVAVNLPSERATTLTATGIVSADNAPSVSDTLTVNVTGGEQQRFDYIPGHVRIFSPSCPSGCTGTDTVHTGGIVVGNLAYGESAQVLLKAYVTNFTPIVTPTVTPNPTATPTPTPTTVVVQPTATPTPTQPAQQAAVLACPSGLVEIGRNSNQIICFNQQQNFTITLSAQGGQGGAGGAGGSANATGGSANASASVVAPAAVAAASRPQGGGTVASVKELPKTGLPLAAWALAGLMPAGLGFKRFGKGSKISETPNFWSQQREFSKE